MVCPTPLRTVQSKRGILFVSILALSLVCLIQQMASDMQQMTSDVAICKKGSITSCNVLENQRGKLSIQSMRIKHFRKQCKSHGLQSNNITSERLSVLHSEKHKLAYRIVPKVGSTFMIQFYKILTDNESAKRMFKMSRNDIHDDQVKLMRTQLTVDQLNTYTVLLMARNPYSRLYSAYIDKVYILNTLHLCKDIILKRPFTIKEQKRSCKFDISFDQFLEYYFENGGTLEQGHYGPIITHDVGNKICSLNDIFIVKQETFSKDIDKVLSSVNMKGREYNTILGFLHAKSIESTIGGIIMTVHAKFTSFIQRNSCLSWKSIARKLWKSFQIQGYISEQSVFPDSKFAKQKKYKSSKYLINVVMQEVKRNTLTTEEKIRQRNRALMNAYSTVNRKYLHAIQKHYAMDFDMFQYGTNLKDAMS